MPVGGCLVPVEELAPTAITEAGCSLGRVDDVGEQDGEDVTAHVVTRSLARDEALNFVQHLVGIADIPERVIARQFDVAGSGDAPGEETTLFSIEGTGPDPLQNEGRGVDVGQRVP